jgi:transcriptional regulator with XRE-family HTH domain
MKNRPNLPLPVSRSLKKFGADIRTARLKRGFTTEMMAERMGVHRDTYHKVEQGDPTASLGIYAAALFALGFSTPFAELVDQRRDDTGILLDQERLPKRVRPKKEPEAL